MELVQERDWFPTGKSDCTGREAVPVELKVSNHTDENMFLLCQILIVTLNLEEHVGAAQRGGAPGGSVQG